MVGNSAYSSLQRWGVMAMAVVSSVSTVASATIINVAPDIMGALDQSCRRPVAVGRILGGNDSIDGPVDIRAKHMVSGR